MRNILFIFIAIFLIQIQTNAQDLKYAEIENELNDEQKEIFNEALKILKKAQGNENNAMAIDRKYSRKKNSPSWEEKTWEAKQQRILAERHYELAYSMISEIYSNLITNAEYKNATDESEALKLNKDAKENLGAAAEVLSQYKEVSKEILVPANYEMLKADLKKGHDLNVEGIRYQITALNITRTGVKSSDDQDLVAWKKAKSKNTIEAYNEYIHNYPNGNYNAVASARIRQIENNSNNITTTNENYIATTDENNNIKTNRTITPTNTNEYVNNNTETGNTNYSRIRRISTVSSNNTNNSTENYNYHTDQLVFKVQIAADNKVVPARILNRKAPKAGMVEVFRTPEWYKYSVGKFNTYEEAARYRDKLKQTAPDAFIVVFENGNQIQVTEEMKMQKIVSLN